MAKIEGIKIRHRNDNKPQPEIIEQWLREKGISPTEELVRHVCNKISEQAYG